MLVEMLSVLIIYTPKKQLTILVAGSGSSSGLLATGVFYWWGGGVRWGCVCVCEGGGGAPMTDF